MIFCTFLPTCLLLKESSLLSVIFWATNFVHGPAEKLLYKSNKKALHWFATGLKFIVDNKFFITNYWCWLKNIINWWFHLAWATINKGSNICNCEIITFQVLDCQFTNVFTITWHFTSNTLKNVDTKSFIEFKQLIVKNGPNLAYFATNCRFIIDLNQNI